MDDRVKEALDYFRADPHMNGPVLLTPSKMRTHLAVIEEALRSSDTGRSEAEAKEAAAKVCHEEQMTVWSSEIVERLAMGDHLPGDTSYEDTLAIHATVADGIRSIVESAFGHPELAGRALLYPPAGQREARS